ncbi:hypothetical protein, partial [Zooshikella harenae]
MKHKIPDESSWGEYHTDLDVAAAHSMFAGKTNEEMQKEFKKNIIERCSDIRWMPIVPFQYYIFGLKHYIDSGDFSDFNKPDAASCFIELVLDKLNESPEYLDSIILELMPTLKYIAENQDWFEADIDIYGDFKALLEK